MVGADDGEPHRVLMTLAHPLCYLLALGHAIEAPMRGYQECAVARIDTQAMDMRGTIIAGRECRGAVCPVVTSAPQQREKADRRNRRRGEPKLASHVPEATEALPS
jgi:cytochrome c5